MKKTFFILTLLFTFSKALISQSNFSYSVQVNGSKEKGLKDVKVWLKEKGTGQTLIQRTDIKGAALFSVPPGNWSVNLIGLPNYDEIVVKEGNSGKGSISLTYNLDKIRKEEAIKKERLKLSFEEEDQTGQRISTPKRGFCVMKVKLKDRAGRIVQKIPVQLVSVKQAKIYKSNTGKSGSAHFLIPIKETYAIDVEGMRNFAFTSFIPQEGVLTFTKLFVPTTIKETVVNDTITQHFNTYSKASSARTLLNLRIFQGNTSEPAANEYVYLNQLSSNQVYWGETDMDGNLSFLLPKGEKYMLHFDFQRDVDVFNFSNVKGIGESHADMSYFPDPKLQFPERYIPDPENLFLEEFKNFITKNLPEPEGKIGLFFDWGSSKVNAQSKEAVLKIGVSGTKEAPKYKNTPFIDFAFVLDRSGSMAGYQRIESLKGAMKAFIDRLRPEDRVALITFNGFPTKEMELQVRDKGLRINKFVDEIEPGGSTNIYEGLVMGYEELLHSDKPERTKQLILLTDGYGFTEPKVVVDKSKAYNEKGLQLAAVGVGPNYNYALLKLLTAEQGRLMEHAGESKDIYTAFDKHFSNMILPIAQNAKLEILFNSKIKFKQLFGLPVHTREKNKVSFELGNLYSGMNKVALAQFDLIRPDKSIEQEPVTLKLSYYDLEKQSTEVRTQQAKLNWEPATGKLELIIEREQKKLYAVAIINQSIKVMAEAFAKGDVPKAKNAVERARIQVAELFPEADEENVNRLLAKLANYALALENYANNQKKVKKS